MKIPFVSIIIPTFNAEKYLKGCLQSIRRQDYPSDKMEVLVIDGGSTDNTLDIARKFKVKILNNPYRDAESGKGIGIKHAKGGIIALIDSDNELVGKNWLKQMVKPFIDDKEIFGVESPWFVNPKDPLINQYVTLLKISDPLARRFHPKMKEEDKGDYVVYTARLRQTPVVGANGFLWRKKMIEKIGKFGDKFEETNYVSYLIQAGFFKFARVKNVGIYHYYIKSLGDYIKKRLKIGRKFMARRARRQETWVDQASKAQFWLAVLYNVSILGPLFEALQEYKKSKNPAWFWHPVVSFLTIAVYFYTTLESLFKKF